MKVSRDEAINISLYFVKNVLTKEGWYLNIVRDIKAILLYGSVAKGENTKQSDIDLMVILPLESKKKFTKGEYIYEFEGHEMNIVLRSIEKLRGIDFARDNFQREIFRGCEIIEEFDSEVRNIVGVSNTML